MFHWERNDYIPTPEEIEMREKMNKKPKKKKRKQPVDDYLMGLEERTKVQLEGSNLRKIKEIPSDHEELIRNPEELNMEGGVDIIDDVKTKFTKRTVKLWFEYSQKFGQCRCMAPAEMNI